MRSFLLLLIAISFVSQAQAGNEAEKYYLEHVKPILAARCYACHGVLKQEANLRLDTATFAIKGGDSGAAIEPLNLESLLITRVSATDDSERMPPEGDPLKSAEIEAVKTWIAQGARAPADEQPERDPRDHWAFKPPVRPAIPQVADTLSNRNPIDAFIEAKRQERALQHQSPADKHVLLRRVYLDLIGLPPTRAQLDAFVANVSPQAYEKVVDQLLESPQYGERWGRHWMDVWRYSDWWGEELVRNSQKHIWHWRDWIIESLNADKGYDQMLREMLAADELYPNDLERLRATGYLARQYFIYNRTTWMDETIEHTSKAMLGMTFNCAKCHDHKYDPIAQTDYYRLRAVFEPYQIRTDLVPGESDFERDGIPRAFDCNLDTQTFLHIRGNESNPDKSRVMEPAVPAFLSSAAWKIEPVSLPAEAYQPGLRPFIVGNYLAAAERKIAEARMNLETARKKLAEFEATEKLAAAQAAASKPTAGVLPLVSDNFETDRPEIWEQQGGKWAYSGGKLVQSQDGAIRGVLRLRQLPPENFEAQLRFQVTGGQLWKAVGIAFDTVDSFESLAYVSAYIADQKSQVSYKSGDNYVYPAEARQSRKIELSKSNEMTLRVKGTLVNLLINGELSVAYRLPVARRSGALQLITFDATTEFSNFELKELPADALLAEAKAEIKPTDTPLNVRDAQLAFTLAEKALAAAEAQPTAIRARAAAEKARMQQPVAENITALAEEAVKLERIAALAKSKEVAAQAELKLARAAIDKKADAEKKLTEARIAIETARKAIEMPGENFTPLIGSQKTVESNLEKEESRSKPFPQTSTGRRSAFAQWLTDPKHPLPARVAINHIWLRHFGRPLVATVFDFGRKGTLPTHPELLDWLAVELVEHGWSTKHIHRLIVTSQTYRMSSSSAGAPRETVAHDPENKYYWRMNPVRMQAQVVRDSLLHLVGELDLTRGGPSIPVNDENSRRRSMYFVHSNKEHQKFLSMFDDASVLDCYRRAESIVPQQALALENSQLATTMGVKIAQRIATDNPGASDREFIRAAFLTVLSVEPSEAELAFAAENLTRLADVAKQQNRPQPNALARINLIHALLNHNDFITVR